MKKLFIGFIAGALFMTAGSALAETVIKNLVGRTIEGQFPVRVDGAYIQNPAIVLDGTSFLPVKEFATTVGYAVYFDPEGEILLEKIVDAQTEAAISQSLAERAAAEQAAADEKTRLANELQMKKKHLADIETEITILQNRKARYESMKQDLTTAHVSNPAPREVDKERYANDMKQLDASIQKAEAEITELQAKYDKYKAENGL